MSDSTDALDRLYAELPTIECQRLCQEACGPIGMTRIEHRRLERGRGELACVGLECPLLVDGACSAYDIRPLICRVFGLSEGLKCPHGCVPSRWLTDEEAFELFRRANAIGGPVRHILLTPEFAAHLRETVAAQADPAPPAGEA